jgi:hypothetical protein
VNIIDKYNVFNLNAPAFLMLELFDLSGYYVKIREENNCEFFHINHKINNCESLWEGKVKCNASTVSYRKQLISTAINEHLDSDAGIMEMIFGRFYKIPLLSFKEVAFSSWVRHFLYYNETVLWPYVDCGNHHINDDGHKLVAYNMIIPFLLDQYNQHDATNNNDNGNQMVIPSTSTGIYSTHIEMFPRYTDKVIENWSLWDNDKDINIFDQIIILTNYWSKEQIREKYVNRCYSSETFNSFALLNITIPHICEKQNISCNINILYLRSWNTSFIGDLKCSLFLRHRMHATGHHHHHKHDGNKGKQNIPSSPLQSDVYVRGNKFHNKHTIPVLSKVFTSISMAGRYEIRCKKPDHKYSCIAGLSLTQTSLSDNHIISPYLPTDAMNND